jgi:transcriptional regulator with XRE-family HTH domain
MVLLHLLRQTREELGLRQTDIAERLGCPQSVVSKYESGARRLDLLELYDLCSVMGVSMTEIVRRFERALGRSGRRGVKRWHSDR